MALIDSRGRILGRINVIDALAAACVVLVAGAVFLTLSAPYRPAAPHAGVSSFWLRAELHLRNDDHWLMAEITPSLERDARSNDELAEIVRVDPQRGVVHVRLKSTRDAQGRIYFRNRVLLPGSEVRIETAACVVEGRVGALTPETDHGMD